MDISKILCELAELDDAIAHAKSVAKRQEGTECGKQHQQLAGWLQELREIKLASTSNVELVGKFEEKYNMSYFSAISTICKIT